MSKIPYAVVTLALLAGCKSAPVVHVKDVGPIKDTGGWTLVESKEHGLSLLAPSGWRSGSGLTQSLKDVMGGQGLGGDSTTSDPNDPASRMSEQFEQAARLDEAKEMAKLAEKGIHIHCVDSSRATIGEARTRFYLKKTAGDGPANLEDAAANEKKELVGPEASDVALAIGPAKRLVSEFTTRGGDKVNRVSYVIVDGYDSYVLRFVSTNNPGAILPIHEQVAQTLRIKPSTVK